MLERGRLSSRPRNTLYLELPDGRRHRLAAAFARYTPTTSVPCGSISTGCDPARAGQFVTQWGDPGSEDGRARAARRAKHPGRGVHATPERPFTRPPTACCRGVGFERFPGRPRCEIRAGLARALLWHGRRRSATDRIGQRQRLYGDRPRATPARPQHRHGRAGDQGHGVVVGTAARHRSARLLRGRTPAPGSPGAHRRRRARGRTQPSRTAAPTPQPSRR